MVVAANTGVVKLVPVPRDTPPVAAAHQLMVPALAVAPRVTVPGPQLLPGVVPVIVGIGLIVAVTAVRVAVVQPAFVASV